MFLSDKELTELTGYKRGKEQCTWLSGHGWMFEVTAHGKPRVAVEYCKQKLGIKSEPVKKWDLDLSSLNLA